MSDELDKLGRMSRSAGGIEGEMIRRRIRAADHGTWEAPQTRLAQLRQDAMDLITPVLRRLLVSYSESLAQAAVETEARLEANGLPFRKRQSMGAAPGRYLYGAFELQSESGKGAV
jgi:hypothetical protein